MYTDTTHEFYSPGVCPGCAVCQQEHGTDEAELYAAWETGNTQDDPEFSWSACECCGSALGGDRYCAHARDKETGEIEHFMVCTDCLEA